MSATKPIGNSGLGLAADMWNFATHKIPEWDKEYMSVAESTDYLFNETSRIL